MNFFPGIGNLGIGNLGFLNGLQGPVLIKAPQDPKKPPEKNYVEVRKRPMSYENMKTVMMYLNAVQRITTTNTHPTSSFARIDKVTPYRMTGIQLSLNQVRVNNMVNLTSNRPSDLKNKMRDMFCGPRRGGRINDMFVNTIDLFPEGTVLDVGGLTFKDNHNEFLPQLTKFIDPKCFPLDFMHMDPDNPSDKFFENPNLAKICKNLYIHLPHARFGRGDWAEALKKLRHPNVVLFDWDISVQDWCQVAIKFMQHPGNVGTKFTVLTKDLHQYLAAAMNHLNGKPGTWRETKLTNSVYDRMSFTLPTSFNYIEINVYVDKSPQYDFELSGGGGALYGVVIAVMERGTSHKIV